MVVIENRKGVIRNSSIQDKGLENVSPLPSTVLYRQVYNLDVENGLIDGIDTRDDVDRTVKVGRWSRLRVLQMKDLNRGGEMQ